MPNWVENILEIEGDPDNIAILRRDLFLPARAVNGVQQNLCEISFDTLEKGVDVYPLKNCVARTISDLFWGHKHFSSHHMINIIVGCEYDFAMKAAISRRNTFNFSTPWSPPDKWVAWVASKYSVNLELGFSNSAECEGGYVRIIDEKISWYNSNYPEYKRHFYNSNEEMMEFEGNLFDFDLWLSHADCIAEIDEWPKNKKDYLDNYLIRELPLKEYLLNLIL